MTAEQKAKAPKLEISATELNLGSFNGKKKLKGLITLTNKGKSELDIRSMQMFTMGLQVSLNVNYGSLRVTNPSQQIKTVVQQTGTMPKKRSTSRSPNPR